MKALTVILIFVSLNVSAQTDKLYHGIAGMMIGGVTSLGTYALQEEDNVLKNLAVTMGVTTTVGLWKEYYDSKNGGCVETMDVVATMAGGVIAWGIMSIPAFDRAILKRGNYKGITFGKVNVNNYNYEERGHTNRSRPEVCRSERIN